MGGSVTTAHLYHLADHAPVTERAIEQGEEAVWALARLQAEGIAFDCPSCGVTLELRHEGKTDVRGNRHGADASQPGPAHPPGDSRQIEGGG